LKVLRFILITIFILIGPTACYIFERCPEVNPYFSIDGVDINALQYSVSSRFNWKLISQDSGPVWWDDLFFVTVFQTSYYSEVSSSSTTNLYALSCPELGYKGAEIGVDTLYLVTLTDYNAEYLQNDTLNNITLVSEEWRVDNLDGFYPIADYIKENRNNIQSESFNLRITEPPISKSSAHQFKVIFVLSNGTIFEAESGPVKLIN
jgi:hypothetical protein